MNGLKSCATFHWTNHIVYFNNILRFWCVSTDREEQFNIPVTRVNSRRPVLMISSYQLAGKRGGLARELQSKVCSGLGTVVIVL